MKDNQTLQDIGDSVAKAADFLQDFDEKKRDCLRAYTESQRIVKWIHDETKGHYLFLYHYRLHKTILYDTFKLFSDLNGLVNFVTIALATAAGGEDAYTRDRLSDLKTVGSGFKDLIYNLPSNADYRLLVNRCNKSLWAALKSTPSLPDMMV